MPDRLYRRYLHLHTDSYREICVPHSKMTISTRSYRDCFHNLLIKAELVEVDNILALYKYSFTETKIQNPKPSSL